MHPPRPRTATTVNKQAPDSFLSRWLREPLRRLAALLGMRAAEEAVPAPAPLAAGRAEPVAIEIEPARPTDVGPDDGAGWSPTQPDAPLPETETESESESESEAEAEAQVVVVPDPEVDALLAKVSGVESMLAELAARQADMQQLMQDFQLRQYQALGDCLAEVLRLRHEHAQRVAARSGLAEDEERARRAAEDLAGLNDTLSVAHDPPPALDDDARDELKRLYRAVAMRCHPDRVGEADKAVAHERFQLASTAYRNHDLAGLSALLAEMDRESGAVAKPAAPPAAELSKRLLAMRNAAADLILAIQTLQLDADYRRALARDDWDDYFDSARASFERECEVLREALAEL